MGLRKNFHSILRCHSHSRSRSFPGITTSHSRSQNSGMDFPFPFPFPKIGNEIFIPIPVPKSWECNLSFPFPFPKFGNGLSHSRSRSQMSNAHCSPLMWATFQFLFCTFPLPLQWENFLNWIECHDKASACVLSATLCNYTGNNHISISEFAPYDNITFPSPPHRRFSITARLLL